MAGSKTNSRSPKTTRPPAKPSTRPSPAALGFLLAWHGVFAGGFFVAMATGFGAYGAHAFAGVVVIFAIMLRLLVGAAFPKGHVLTFPLPARANLRQGTHGYRRFISHTVGVVVLGVCALAALTGWYAWSVGEAHGAVSYFAFAVIGWHVVLVLVMQGWKKVEAFARSRS